MTFDERIYAVVAPYGYRKPGLTKAEAEQHATRLAEQMRTAGWRGNVDIVYRDGSVVERKRVGT